MASFRTFDRPLRSFGLILSCGCGLALAGPAGAEKPEEGVGSSEPVAAFVEHCYEPIQITGRPKLPVPGRDDGWSRADGSMRASLEMKMSGEPLLLRSVGEGGVILVQFRERVLVEASGPDQNETRQLCRIMFQGARPEAVYTELVGLLDGIEGYTDPGGLQRCGYEMRDGWEQWVWSDNPRKIDNAWKIYEMRTRRGVGRGRSACIWALKDGYYTFRDLIHVRYLVRKSDPKVGVIELRRTFRPDNDGPTRRPKVRVRPLGSIGDDGSDETGK